VAIWEEQHIRRVRRHLGLDVERVHHLEDQVTERHRRCVSADVIGPAGVVRAEARAVLEQRRGPVVDQEVAAVCPSQMRACSGG